MAPSFFLSNVLLGNAASWESRVFLRKSAYGRFPRRAHASGCNFFMRGNSTDQYENSLTRIMQSSSEDELWSSENTSFGSTETSSGRRRDGIKSKFWATGSTTSSSGDESPDKFCADSIASKDDAMPDHSLPDNVHESKASLYMCELVNEIDQMRSATSVRRVNIDEYLEQVESELQKQGPCLQITVTGQHRKTMLRTLLGITNKVDFDQMMRAAQNELQRSRMVQFLEENVSVIVGEEEAVLLARAPNFYAGREKGLNLPALKGADVCSLMAQGARYRGDFMLLLQDVAPDVVPRYIEATKKVTEEEIMFAVVENAMDLDEARKEAAKQCISCRLPCSAKGTILDGGVNGRKDGLDCEKACIEFLKKMRHSGNALILQNIFVKPSDGRRQSRDRGTVGAVEAPSLARLKEGNKSIPENATITTTLNCEKICSEFDAIVAEIGEIESGRVWISEVWEAKATISPTTIIDTVFKKRPAFESVLADPITRLCLGDEAIAMEHDQPALFGLFGKAVLPAVQSANQMKVIACTAGLARDVDVVLEALRSGYAQVKATDAVDRLASLRVALMHSNDFAVVVRDIL